MFAPPLIALAVVFSGLTGQPPTERPSLLLDAEAGEAFVQRFSRAFVQITYFAPLLPGEDDSFQMSRQTLAAWVDDGAGQGVLLAAEHRLAGVSHVQVMGFDATGARVTSEAAVHHSLTPKHIPFVRLTVKDPALLVGVKPLVWAPDESVVLDAFGVALEWPSMPSAFVDTVRALLISTLLGPKADFPLERFHLIDMRNADGLAVINTEGEVLCVVFRGLPATGYRTSLCAPRKVALSRTFTPGELTEPEGISVIVPLRGPGIEPAAEPGTKP